MDIYLESIKSQKNVSEIIIYYHFQHLQVYVEEATIQGRVVKDQT